MRKDLNPVLKKARQEGKLAFFNVEKLIIDGKIYRGPETRRFPFYGRVAKCVKQEKLSSKKLCWLKI